MLVLDRQKTQTIGLLQKIMEGSVENNHTNIKPLANLYSKNCVVTDQNCSENPLFGVDYVPEYGLVLDGVSPSILFQVGSKDMVFFDRVVDLVGFIGLNGYPEEEMDQKWVDLPEFDGFDSKGLKLNLGLQATQNQITFVVINGVDYVTGWINLLDTKQMPTLMKQLEDRVARLIGGMSSFGPNKFPGTGPVSLLPPRDPFADSNFSIGGVNMKVNGLAIPPSLKIKAVDRLVVPCLLCYSDRNWVGNCELYIPAIDRGFSPQLSINFSRYWMVAQNHNSCEFLFFDLNENEVVIYRGLDDEVITFPTLAIYLRRGRLIGLFGWFERVAGDREVESEYYVLMVSLHAMNERTSVSFYWRYPSQAEWDGIHYDNVSPHVQRPMAPMVTKVTMTTEDELFEGELFAWVDASVGVVLTVTDWRSNYPRIETTFGWPLFQDAVVIFSVNDGNTACFVVYRNNTYLVVDVRFEYDEDGGMEIDYIPRANLNDRNFYCSRNVFGFSADPFVHIAGPMNHIYIGGWLGNCCVINNFIEMAAGFDAGLHVQAEFSVLRLCHNPPEISQPEHCECESAFFLLPVHMVERIFPDFASLVRRSA